MVSDILETILKVTEAASYTTAMATAATAVTGLAGAELSLGVTTGIVTAAQTAGQIALQVYIAASAAAAAATGTLAAAQAAASAATGVLTAALAGLDLALAPIIGIFIAISAAVVSFVAAMALAKAAIESFADESRELFQAQLVFQNLGTSLPIEQFRQFANTISSSFGISRREIESAGAVLAEVGVKGSQMQEALKTIADLARGTNKSFGETAESFAAGIEGRTRALRAFRIEIENTGSRAANLARIEQQAELRYRDAAEAFRNTLPGAIDTLHVSLANLLSDIGEKLAPAIVPVVNLITDAVQWLDRNLDVLAVSIGTLVGQLSPLLGFIAAMTGLGAHLGNSPAAQMGRDGQPATEKTVQQIADNTAKTADVIEQAVLGGAGTRAKQAFTWRDYQMSLRI